MRMYRPAKRQRSQKLLLSSVAGTLLVSVVAGMQLGVAHAQTNFTRPPEPVRYVDVCNVPGEYDSFQAVCDARRAWINWPRPLTYVQATTYRGDCVDINPEYGSATLGFPFAGQACPDGYTMRNFVAYDRNFACGSQPGYFYGPAQFCEAQLQVIEKFHDKLQFACPGFGKPIFPLTGSKRLTTPVVGWPTFAPLEIAYDTRRKVPDNDPGGRFGSLPAASFGGLWESNWHRQLVIQPSQSSLRSIQASRGAGKWVSFATFGGGSYAPDPDVSDRLIKLASGWRYVDAAAGAIETYDSAGNLLSVARAQGTSLSFFRSDATTLPAIAPGPGYLIKIQDDFGRNVQFRYSAAGRISQVLDPGGAAIGATYDASGNLQTLTWQDLRQRQFVYENASFPWALTGVLDENNARTVTYGYDAQGRANETQAAQGVEHFTASYGTPPGWVVTETIIPAAGTIPRHILREHRWQAPEGTVVALPNGTTTSLGTQTVQGMARLSSQSQPAGSGCAASTSNQTYDANSNITSKDDFNGTRTCYAYDLSRNLETTRVEGLANTVDCSAVTPANAVLPAGSRRVSTQWHPDWRLKTAQTELKKLTTWVYNGQPDPFNANPTTIANCAPGTALLPDGKPIPVLCKTVEQAATGGDGSQANAVPATDDPYFDNVSLLLHMDGTNGSTSFTDSSSRIKVPTNTVGPLVTDTGNAKFGNAAGNFTGGYLWYAPSTDWDMGSGPFTAEAWVKFNSASMGSRVFIWGQADSNSSTTTFWTAKRTDNTLYAGASTSTGGAAVTGTSPVAANIWYHLALVRSGNTITLYRNGSVEATAAVSGSIPVRTQHLGIGVYGEYIGLYGTDYGARMMGWLDEVRITKGVARYTGAFTVPGSAFPPSAAGLSGSPYTVPDPSVPARINTYTYNQYGQILTDDGPRTDVSDVTTYAYYSDITAEHTLGDLRSITNAAGKVTQYTKYNKHGQLLESIDPNGVLTVNTYDLRQRLLSTSVGGQTTSYSYDPVGQLTRVTQPDASYLGYEYDDAHRQKAVFDNRGNRIEYTLDNAGVRIAENVRDPAGALRRTLSRSIDALGRVQQTTGRE